jgi:hypothetical protein
LLAVVAVLVQQPTEVVAVLAVTKQEAVFLFLVELHTQ